jgi:hypothetical protein
MQARHENFFDTISQGSSERLQGISVHRVKGTPKNREPTTSKRRRTESPNLQGITRGRKGAITHNPPITQGESPTITHHPLGESPITR